MIDNKILGSVLFLAILGIFFIGNGITGMVVEDEYVKPLCTQDSECLDSGKCCLFQNSQAGVCGDENTCTSISIMTVQKYEYASTPKDVFAGQLVVGLLIIVSIFLILYFSVHTDRTPQSE